MLKIAPEGQVFETLARVLDSYASNMTALNAAFQSQEKLRSNLISAVECIASRNGRVILTGVGKSGLIGRKIAATMASTGTPAYFVHPTEASHGDLGMISVDDVVIALSWSGETTELAAILQYVKRFNVSMIGITSNARSSLARHASITIALPKLPEVCTLGLAPTTSTMMQLAIGDAIALALLERRGFSATDFRVFHPGGKLGAQLKTVDEICHDGEKMPLVPTGTPIGEAILIMSQKGFGVVGVVENDKLVGVITDGDLRRHMSSTLLEMTAEAVMSANPKTCSPSMLASAALEMMQSKSISVLFVVDEERPVGILHVHDLLREGVV